MQKLRNYSTLKGWKKDLKETESDLERFVYNVKREFVGHRGRIVELGLGPLSFDDTRKDFDLTDHCDNPIYPYIIKTPIGRIRVFSTKKYRLRQQFV